VAEEIDNIPPNAFFVIDGVKFYPLVKAVINIGRRLENDLVIDDPRVSRSHAQLRAIEGHYVLFDLSSTGGTFVNGSRVSETIIYPNDAISLGGVTLNFHQDDPPPRTDLIDTVR
jgi:pSer/pThr/pTyr-binding forkhead associated (FHA) protein